MTLIQCREGDVWSVNTVMNQLDLPDSPVRLLIYIHSDSSRSDRLIKNIVTEEKIAHCQFVSVVYDGVLAGFD